MALIIVDEKVGKVGDVFDVAKAEKAGIDIPALIEGGFLVEDSAKKKKASEE